MNQVHPAEDKVREAEFFFMLMEKHFHEYEFKYFVSAFLSALSGCTEHLRLFSPDPRFKDWYRDITQNLIPNSELPRLDKLRNKEIHQKGTEAYHRIGFNAGPEGITTTSLEFTVDFRSGAPTGTIKTAEMQESEPIELKSDCVWMVDGEPSVMKLCLSGLNTVRGILESRHKMGFKE